MVYYYLTESRLTTHYSYCLQIASHSDVKELLEQWDVSETEALQNTYQEKREKRLEDEKSFHKQEENK